MSYRRYYILISYMLKHFLEQQMKYQGTLFYQHVYAAFYITYDHVYDGNHASRSWLFIDIRHYIGIAIPLDPWKASKTRSINVSAHVRQSVERTKYHLEIQSRNHLDRVIHPEPLPSTINISLQPFFQVGRPLKHMCFSSCAVNDCNPYTSRM